MNRMRNALLIAVALCCASPVFADNSWLYGTWWYAHATGDILLGEDKDGMVFKPGGAVDLIDENAKPWLSCHYNVVTRNQIILDCIVRGKPRQLRFTVNDERTRIANDADTDNGFYRR